MIVKVQVSVYTSEDEPQVLAYTEGKKNWYQGDAFGPVLEMMGGEDKKFFYAYVPYESGQIEILEEAPWQDW